MDGLLPLELTAWSSWLSQYPSTEVLSNETGYRRNYERTPYQEYMRTERLMFPVPSSNRLPAKEPVLGVFSNSTLRAYPLSDFSAEKPILEDRIDGKPLRIEFLPSARSLRIVEADQSLSWIYSFWFSWYAMHPDTEIYASQP
ncbi:MAG: DUF3179 domain-containing protein [Pirellulales bacterium]|nr:DUF3179 domain-containing protein [Pirellulales bacterium]